MSDNYHSAKGTALITLTKNTWSNLGHKLVISWSFDGVLFGEDLTNIIVISWSFIS